MSKGLTLPLVIIFIALFIAVPVFFYLYTNKNLTNNLNIKGVTSEVPSKPGVTLRLTSIGGTWDMHQYLCDEKDACLSSLTIGSPRGVISGGLTKDYEFNIAPDQTWDAKFKYLKIFARSGWGSLFRTFSVSVLNQGDLVEIHTIVDETKDYSVVIIPLENINTSSNILIEFRD